MKKILNILFVSAIALASFSSCQKESELLNKGSKEGKKAIMTVKAGNATTKTAITEVGDHNYTLQWTAGDAIAAYEVSTVASVPTIQPKVTSTALAAAADNATFTMDFSKNGGESDFSYIFVYPAANYNEVSGDYLATIPASQTFKSATFDPDADLLISKPLAAQATRPTSVSAQFERIGATVVMNIKAPTTSEKIRAIYFSTTEGNIAGSVAVDPLAGTYGHTITANQSKEIELIPESEPTYTGTIPVWFRMAAINLDSNFKVVIDTDAKTYTKTVDLSAAGKIVKFEDGGLTKFNVNMESVSGDVNRIALSSANIATMTGTSYGYGVEKTATISGNIWASTGYKSAASDGFLQLKSDGYPYLEIPPVSGIIRKIVLSVTGASAASEGASTVNSTMTFRGDMSGSNLGSSSSDASSTKIITLSGTNYRSGYVILTAGNVPRVWGCTVYYTVDTASMTDLSIVTDPTKNTYTTDDDYSDIDFTGGKAIATYSNGTLANVSRLLSFSCDFSTTGAKTVTASYGGYSDTFDVTVEEAGDPLVYTLSGSTKTGTSSNDSQYDKSVDYDYTDGATTIGWNVTGNSSMEPWRIGGKGLNIKRAIYSTDAISENISKIEVLSGAKSNLTVNYLKITVHSSDTDASTGSNAVASYTCDTDADIVNKTVTFTKGDKTSWAGKYFRIEYEYYNTTASEGTKSNGYVQFNAAKFYGK